MPSPSRAATAPLPDHARPVLELAGVSKRFPGVKALDDVALALYSGQVTALVGENGAGKSTLVKILTGIYQPDAGRITLDGAPVAFPTPHAAALAGVTAIHQETVLFDELSVAENIFLGHAPRGRFGLIDRPRMEAEAREMLTRVGAAIDPRVRLRDLGIANKHLVAMARALSIDARVVIMDEPTAALSHKEIAELYELIEQAEGGRQGDPLHQPQVRRDLPHRRPLHRLPRRPPGRRGPHRRGHRGRAGPPDGRPRRRSDLPPPRAGALRGNPPGRRLQPPDRVRGHRLHPAPRRDPGLLRAGRGRPQRGDAGALRHHPARRRAWRRSTAGSR